MNAMRINPTTEFRMACPKCGSRSSYSIHRQGSYQRFPDEDEWYDVVFSCMCGTRLYGRRVKEEWDGQEEEHVKAVQAEVRRKAAEEAKRRKEEAERKRREEAERKQREEEERRRKELECAWMHCTNPRRPNSKYCSRECSNKNARHRHAVRGRA